MAKKELRPQVMDALSSEFDAVFDKFTDDLSRVKGWSPKSVFKVIFIILDAVPEMVPSWMMATPDEREAAVVTRVNEHINMPIFNEPQEAVIIHIAYHAILPFLGLL